MFGEFHHLPVHILVIHAVIVLVPLTGLLGVLFVYPRTQQWARTAFALVAVGALVMTFVARQSGVHLMHNLDSRGAPAPNDLLATHQSRGNTLFYEMIGFAIVAVAAWLLTREPGQFQGAVALGVSALVIVAVVATGIQVYLVGEIGSKMVWNPNGDINFSNT
ncbi:MAG TPA: DUF2231 domain-containing protein [Nocardioidaceae bacterium]|nr:DUF2231 domain-containing protein [Nocardioidaceae bacterium]